MIARLIALSAMVAASLAATSPVAARQTSSYSDLLIELFLLIKTEHLTPPPDAALVNHTLEAARRLAADGNSDFEKCLADAVTGTKHDANIVTFGFIPICLGFPDGEPDKAESAFTDLAKAMLSAIGEDDNRLFYGAPKPASIGVSIGQDDNGTTIRDVVSSGPAERAGVKPGDKLIDIDGASVSTLSLDAVADELRGDAGTFVTLGLGDSQENRRVITILRETVRPPPALMVTREGDRLLLSIHSMPAKLAEGIVREMVPQMEGVRLLILDLRGNSGGVLREAVEIADLFLSKGVIARTEGRKGMSDIYKATKKAYLPDADIIVLADEGTASGAELVAAALADNGRARIAGRRTFGMGNIRTVFPLGEQRAVAITTHRLLRPNGAAITGAGIKPDCPLDTWTFDLATFQPCTDSGAGVDDQAR